MVFRFRYHSKENTTEIHVRFVKSYDLTYNLDGGSLPKDSVTSYHSLAETTLPTLEKKGYNFAGWTGEGLKTKRAGGSNKRNLRLNYHPYF